MNEQKKSSIGFWITVTVVAVLVLYPLSFGPACWIASQEMGTHGFINLIYRPMIWVVIHYPESKSARAIRRYASRKARHRPQFGTDADSAEVLFLGLCTHPRRWGIRSAQLLVTPPPNELP